MPKLKKSRKEKSILVNKKLFDSYLRLQDDMMEMMDQMYKDLETERKTNAKPKK